LIVHIEIDEDLCIGAGICESIAPDVFQVQEEKATLLLSTEITADNRDLMTQAVSRCPAAALRIEE
jgi:ferredoxin